MNSQHHQNNEGPPIKVHFLLHRGTIITTALEKSNIFEWNIKYDAESESFINNINQWMQGYAKKRPATISLPLLTPIISPPFSQKVLSCLQKVPFGEKISYGALASKAGNSKASRAVGSICAKNCLPLLIPCHRVIPSTGKIGNFREGTEIKSLLLEFEGSLSIGT